MSRKNILKLGLMIPNFKYKTVLCRYWENNGLCPLGARCHFAHGKQELRRVTDTLPGNAPYIVDPKQKQSHPNYSNYKTIKCKYFELNLCKNGANCSFAHGEVDMRKPGDPISPNSIPQPSQQHNMQPQESNDFDRVVKTNQIKFMIQMLHKMYMGDKNAESILNQSLEHIMNSKIEEAAFTLQKIVYDPNATAEVKAAHAQIIDQAKDYGLSLLNQGSQPMLPQSQTLAMNAMKMGYNNNAGDMRSNW